VGARVKTGFVQGSQEQTDGSREPIYKRKTARFQCAHFSSCSHLD
jgi:hypothetical protein